MTFTIAPAPLQYSHTIGNLALTGRGFSNPYDITVVGGRLLYVLSRSNANQAPQGAVRVTICTVDEEYVGTMCGYGEDDGGLVWPTAITSDSEGNIYIADEHRHDVQVFNRDMISCGSSAPTAPALPTWTARPASRPTRTTTSSSSTT